MSSELFKIFPAVLANGADEIFGQFFTLVNITADLADPAAFLFGSLRRLWLDVLLIVFISHRGLVRENFAVGHFGNEHRVRSEVDLIHDFSREKSVCAALYIDNAVVGIAGRKFIRIGCAELLRILPL